MIHDTESQEVSQQIVNQEDPIAQENDTPREETNAAQNLRKLREKAERIERERDEAFRRIQELESKNQKETESDDDIQIGPDDLAEGKHLSRVAQKIKKLEAEVRQYKQQTSTESTEARLKAQYGDFDKVVCKENIEALRNEYPEIASSIHSNPDLYMRAVSAYTLIKKMGIYGEPQSADLEKAIAQKNSAKPRPLASISPQQGDSPLSRANAFANGLTDDLKAQLWKEMRESSKRS